MRWPTTAPTISANCTSAPATSSRALKSDLRSSRLAGCRLRCGDVMNYGSLNKLMKDTPIFLSKDMIDARTRIKLIGDVSCEPAHPGNPIPIYSAPTDFEKPVVRTLNGIDVMAIDNITAMLPVERSQIL